MKTAFPSRMRFATLLLLVACLAASTGCKQWNLTRSWTWLPGSEDPPEVPVKVVAVWTNGQLQQDNGTSLRGFGARLMFYNKEDKPVRVEGKLVVYAFDEQKPEGKSSQADRRYVFTAEQLAEHYSKTQLGHSYSIFVPWDKAGAPAQQVSLIVRFNPLGGPAVVGSQAKLSLPGQPLDTSAIASREMPRAERLGEVPFQPDPSQRVQPVAHYNPLPARQIGEGGPGRRPQMHTTTIPLPTRGR